MDTILGTCSLCGGAVVVLAHWAASIPQTPTCRNCGAVPVNQHGPVVEMQPKRSVNDGIELWINGVKQPTNPY